MNEQEPLTPMWRKLLAEVSTAAAHEAVAADKRGQHDIAGAHAITAILSAEVLRKDRALRAGDN